MPQLLYLTGTSSVISHLVTSLAIPSNISKVNIYLSLPMWVSLLQLVHLRHDYRFMPQIVSSAIWNCPPPHALITLLERTNKSSKLNHNTQEKIVKAFDVRLSAALNKSSLRVVCPGKQKPYCRQPH